MRTRVLRRSLFLSVVIASVVAAQDEERNSSAAPVPPAPTEPAGSAPALTPQPKLPEKSDLDKGLLLKFGVGVGVGFALHTPSVVEGNRQTQYATSFTPYIALFPFALVEALLDINEIPRTYCAATGYMDNTAAQTLADGVARATPGETGWRIGDPARCWYRRIGLVVSLPAEYRSNLKLEDGSESAASMRPQYAIGVAVQLPFGFTITASYMRVMALSETDKALNREVPTLSFMLGSTLDILKSLRL